MNPIGRGRVENEIVDNSQLIATGLKGIIAVIGATYWGVHGKSVLVGSEQEYYEEFGGLLGSDDFPLLCVRALRLGAKLRITRAGHYTNPADISTLQGVEAFASITSTIVAAVAGTGSVTPTAVEETENAVINAGDFNICDVATGATTSLASAAIIGAINGGTGTHGYSAAAGTGDEVVITAPLGLAGNSAELVYNNGITGVATVVQVTGGLDATTVGTATFTAVSVGAWANSILVTVANAVSGNASNVDIKIEVVGRPDLEYTYSDFVRTFTAENVADFNLKSKYIQLTVNTGDLPVGSYQLATGAENQALINNADYVGNLTGQTGIHVFDNDLDFTRISILSKAIPALDLALVAYVTTRKDCRAWLRTPTGISGKTAIDYRNGTGAYAHTAIDTWRASMWFGTQTVSILGSGDVPDSEKEITVMGDVVGLAGAKDNAVNEWATAAGPKRGRIIDSLGVTYNLGSPARATEFDSVDINGINAVVNDVTYGTVLWGNGTLQKKKTLLSHENIAELLVHLVRTINPLAKSELFDPNDPITWSAIYKKVRPVMESIKANRGVFDYKYDGDQFISDIADAVVNQPANIDAGQYIFHLFIKPVPAMKYVGIKTIVTNVGVDFELV